MNNHLTQLEKNAKKYKVPNICDERDIIKLGIPEFYKTVPQLQPFVKSIGENKPMEKQGDDTFIDPNNKKWNFTKSKQKISGSHINVITIPQGYGMYKGFNSFITPSLEKDYMETVSKPTVMWFTSRPIYGLVYAMELNGGLNTYKTSKPLTLAVFNQTLVTTFYAALEQIVKENPTNDVYRTILSVYKLGMGNNSKFDTDAVVNAHYKPYGKYSDKWDRMCFNYSPHAWDYRDYSYEDIGSLQRIRSIRTLVYRYLMFPIMIHMGIDGILIPQHKNPYTLERGQFSQEIILHSYDDILTRNTDNPLDWVNWNELIKSIPEIQAGISVSMSAALKNRDFVMIKWFYKQKKLESELLKSTKFKSNYVKLSDSKSLSICSINVAGFESIDSSQSTDDCIGHLCEFVKNINCDILCLQEIHRGGVRDLISQLQSVGFLYNTNMTEKLGNIIFSKMCIKNSRENIIRDVDDEKNSSKHSKSSTTMQLFVELLTVTNLQLSFGKKYYSSGYTKSKINSIKKENDTLRLEEVTKSMGSDIILGDFNATIDDISMKYILDNGYVTNQSEIKETDPFGSSIDHVFVSKEFAKQYKSYSIRSYPYVWSDHNALILNIGDFF
jgi:exonuclease III